MSLINFESSWKKAADRVEIRSAREKVLEDAEARARKVAKRKAKEDSWMLPDLDQDLNSSSNKKHKKSKRKKEKKKKKQKKEHKSSKHKKHKRSRSSSSSSSSSEDEWVEQPSAIKNDNKAGDNQANLPQEQEKANIGKRNVERESWMNMESLVDRTVDSKDVRGNREEIKAEERKRKEDSLVLEANKREINSGIVHEAGGKLRELNTGASSSNSGSNQIRDGEASWLRRAFQRAKEQAEREGKSIDEIARVRWGSLEKFQTMLAKAEGRADNTDNYNSSKNSSTSNQRYSSDRQNEKRHVRPRSNSRSPDREYHKRDDKTRDRYHHSKYSNHRERDGGGRGWKNEERLSREKREAYKSDRQRRRRSSSSSSTSSKSTCNDKESDKLSKNIKPLDDAQSESNNGAKENKKRTESPEKDSIQEVVLMSDKEMNILGAKLVKAEIMGNTALAEKLKAKLDAARNAKESAKDLGETPSDSVIEKEIILTRTDSRGMTRPVEANVDRDKGGGKRKKKGKVETHVKGERQRYFADDDRFDLKQMYEREKMSTSEDQNSMLSRLAGRADEKTNEDYDFDDLITDRASTKRSEEADAIRERDKAIAENRRLNEKMEECKFCFGTKNMQKHLIVAVGRTCYLCLPHHTPLTEGHCFIAPLSHASCGVQLDEDVWSEMQEFRKSLTRMFQDDDDGDDCVFFESALRLKKHPHMLLECVPIPREVGETAPMYFQKAIQECESEWSHNKKLISLTRERDLRRSVPKGLPYFHVDFGLEDGFAHVIEDEQEFQTNFAQEIIGGMLDLEPRVWRHPKRESFESQKKRVLAFAAKWKNVDFTKKTKSRRDETSDSSSDSN